MMKTEITTECNGTRQQMYIRKKYRKLKIDEDNREEGDSNIKNGLR